MRGVPVNVNYRYLDEELWYLLDNSDSEALVFHSSLGDRVARVSTAAEAEAADRGRRRRRRARCDGAARYEEVIAERTSPMARITRSEDDIYMLYTGGTTGMPKGVMYDDGRPHAASSLSRLSAARARAARRRRESARSSRAASTAGNVMVSMPAAPLMHGTGCGSGR